MNMEKRVIRVGIDAHMLGDHSGGNESYYTNILDAMVPDEDMEILLFVREGVDVRRYRDRFRIVTLPAGGGLKRTFLTYPRLTRTYKLDVLHTQYYVPPGCVCPVICTIFDICFEHYDNIFTKRTWFSQKTLIPYAARHAAKVVTISDYSREDIMRHYGIPRTRFVMAGCAVSDRFTTLSPGDLREEDLRARFGIGKAPFVLTVGNLQPRKNLTGLIEAFQLFQENAADDTRLVIVGKKAWMYDKIMESAKGQDRIVLTDYVSEEDLIRLYNAAACFVYPSFFEGFGIPPLEAMACGTPVAVSDRTSLPEVAGDAGLYFSPDHPEEIAEAIRVLMTDRERARALREKGLARAGLFSWERSAKRLVSCYREIAGNKRTPANGTSPERSSADRKT